MTSQIGVLIPSLQVNFTRKMSEFQGAESNVTFFITSKPVFVYFMFQRIKHRVKGICVTYTSLVILYEKENKVNSFIFKVINCIIKCNHIFHYMCTEHQELDFMTTYSNTKSQSQQPFLI